MHHDEGEFSICIFGIISILLLVDGKKRRLVATAGDAAADGGGDEEDCCAKDEGCFGKEHDERDMWLQHVLV